MRRFIFHKRMTFNAYLDGYLRDVRSGIRKTARGRDFAEGTIYTISSTVMLLKAYQEDRRMHLDFRDIDLEFYRNFVAYLKDKGYRTNTVGKYVSTLKTILGEAESDGVNTYMTYKDKKFKVLHEPTSNIYLTDEEVFKIYNLDLSGMSECYGKARDLFIIGICTAQRVSDFTQFRKEDVFRLEDGHLYIKIIQKKTGKTVCIPCNSTLRELMVKYNFVVPKMPPQHINKYIKIVAEMAGLGDKAARITTHTARRTGATLMYLAGMDLTDVMTITGHSSLAMLKVYIKADEIDIVEKIVKKYNFFD